MPTDLAHSRTRAATATKRLPQLQAEANRALGITRRLGRRLMYELKQLERQDIAADQEIGWSGLPGKYFVEQVKTYRELLAMLLFEQRKRQEAKMQPGDAANDEQELIEAFDQLTDEEFSLLLQRRAAMAKDGNAEDGQ